MGLRLDVAKTKIIVIDDDRDTPLILDGQVVEQIH